MARIVSIAAVLAIALGGCGGDGGGDGPPARAKGKTLSVYVGVPRSGTEAAAGKAVLRGARRALADAGGRAGGKPIRIAVTSTTRPGDYTWDPGTVEASAEAAADDPSTIAYIGEVERGASAVSLPVTNRKGILQVSPTDSLTSLTRRAPGKPRSGPERYYPDGRRTFVRMTANDLAVTSALTDLTSGRRRVVIVTGNGIGARELASTLSNRLRADGREPVDQIALRDDRGAVGGAVEDVVKQQPDVVLVTGSEEPAMGAFLSSLATALPEVPVFTDAGVLGTPGADSTPPSILTVTPVLPAEAQPPAGRRMLRELGDANHPEALYGYAAMETVLRAVAAGGSDRAAVGRAARAPGANRTVLGKVTTRRTGDAGRPVVALVRPGGDGPTFERLLP